MKILDLWCGDGNNKHKIYSKNNEVYGVDIEQENVDHCKRKFPKHKFILVDWEILPFDNDFFDVIHSMDVLEHVDDLDVVLKEATRVLKPWGKFMIEVPYWKSEELLLKIKPEYRKQVHHVRMFKDEEMEKTFEKLWYTLAKKKKKNFFIHIYLAFAFKRANIINQKWSMDLSIRMKLYFMARYFIFFMIYKIYPSYFDNKFPKSIYFEFIKK